MPIVGSHKRLLQHERWLTARPEVSILGGAMFSGFSPSGGTPVPPQPHIGDRSTAKKQIWGSSPPTREHGLTTERTVWNTEQWGLAPQHPGQALVTVTQLKPRSREQGHTPLDQPHPPSCRHQKEDELGSCSLQKRDHRQKTGQNEMAKKWVIEIEATSNLAWTTK